MNLLLMLSEKNLVKARSSHVGAGRTEHYLDKFYKQHFTDNSFSVTFEWTDVYIVNND